MRMSRSSMKYDGFEQETEYLPEALRGVARNHLASFDYFLDHGLSEVVRCLDNISIQPSGAQNTSSSPRFKMWFENISIGRPIREDTTAVRARDPRVFPRECRGRQIRTRRLCWQQLPGHSGISAPSFSEIFAYACFRHGCIEGL